MNSSAFDPSKIIAETEEILAKAQQYLTKVQEMEVSRPNLLGLFEKFNRAMGRYPTRDDFAAQLILNIQNILGISLNSKQCIDIGCRSGENTIAMQLAGAQVIGIDPDDSEFEIAKKKGMENTRLFKATLQEYHLNGPNQKFDIATVFLWNIPFEEREAFTATLKRVIHPDGYIIIGYADEPYDKDPHINIRKLMASFFSCVERFEFPDSLNQYMLKCSDPTP